MTPRSPFYGLRCWAMVGSFFNVCIVRLPKGDSLVSLLPHCPHCKTPIPFLS
ncbi:MAG: prepilin peptidase [Deltaproteobacteria bacterium]|nr:prepilin peptidase [Deltaproteobacteria bacterium]